MSSIREIRKGSRGGKDGFIITWEYIGFTKADAKFRAVLQTAMRFPTTITEAEVINVTEFENNDFNVEVFVPTEGFPSAGITAPVKWVRDNFGKRFRE